MHSVIQRVSYEHDKIGKITELKFFFVDPGGGMDRS